MTLALISTVGIPGPSRALHNPPRRVTPRRVLRFGLRFVQPSSPRHSIQCLRLASHVSAPPACAVRPDGVLWNRLRPAARRGEDAFDPAFISKVLNQKPETAARGTSYEGRQEADIAPFNDPSWQPPRGDDATAQLLRALREANVAVLWDLTRCLDHPDETMHRRLLDALADLPTASFSELLWLLEPDSVQRHVHGDQNRIFISAGMVQMTPLSSLVDELGIRRTYTQLYSRLAKMCASRLQAGKALVRADYKILLRSAGATMDVTKVKTVWVDFLKSHMKTTDVVTEFVKARFLTEPAYCQYDLARFRVRPLNLNMRKLRLGRVRYAMLERIRQRTARTRHDRFGQNPAVEDSAQHISRMLSKVGPVWRLIRHNTTQGIPMEEALACAALVAFSRTSSTRAAMDLLIRHSGVVAKVSKTGSGSPARLLRDPTVLRWRYQDHRGSLSALTQRLLLAVVNGYCSMSEVPLALSIVDTLSRLYNIKIPEQLWFNLLEWVYVLASYPAKLEWKIMQPLLENKVMSTSSVLQIWEVMTSAPYNVQPGAEQYYIIIKTLFSRGESAMAVELMEKLVLEYEGRLRELESAAVEEAHARGLGFDPAMSSQRYHAAVLSKWTLWFYIHRCTMFLLRAMIRRNGRADADARTATTLLPDCIAAFERFLPRAVEYKVATGLVTLEPGRQVGAQSYVLEKETFAAPPTTPVRSTRTRRILEKTGRRRHSLARLKRDKPRWVTRDIFPRSLSSTFSVPADLGGHIKQQWVERQFA